MSQTSERVREPSVLDRVDDRIKVLCVVAFVAAVALLPDGAWARFGALAGLLLLAYLLGRVPLLWALKRLPLLLPVFLLVGLSAWISTRGESGMSTDRFLSVLVGASMSLLALALMAYNPGPDNMLRALQFYFRGSFLVTLLTMTHRYIVVIVAEARRMLRARDSRGQPPRVLDRARVAGSMVGYLFVRSLQRAERVGHAMEARGFTGVYPRGRVRPLRWTQLVAGLTFCAAMAAVVVIP